MQHKSIVMAKLTTKRWQLTMPESYDRARETVPKPARGTCKQDPSPSLSLPVSHKLMSTLSTKAHRVISMVEWTIAFEAINRSCDMHVINVGTIVLCLNVNIFKSPRLKPHSGSQPWHHPKCMLIQLCPVQSYTILWKKKNSVLQCLT